jgi:DNA-binding MarR family transcriptional regulator
LLPPNSIVSMCPRVYALLEKIGNSRGGFMNGKHALSLSGGSLSGGLASSATRGTSPNPGMIYDKRHSETHMTKRGGISDVALIRGTMLELVRRDGRDLTARQLTTLLTVYLEDDVHSVSSLARMLNISRPGVTRILDRLVEADLVSRAEDAADRRRVLVYRTIVGSQYIRDFGDVADHVAAELATTEPARLS